MPISRQMLAALFMSACATASPPPASAPVSPLASDVEPAPPAPAVTPSSEVEVPEAEVELAIDTEGGPLEQSGDARVIMGDEDMPGRLILAVEHPMIRARVDLEPAQREVGQHWLGDSYWSDAPSAVIVIGDTQCHSLEGRVVVEETADGRRVTRVSIVGQTNPGMRMGPCRATAAFVDPT